ncbi:MAG: hypothetical protein R3E58_03630 [Phycisphaerae bacterium]
MTDTVPSIKQRRLEKQKLEAQRKWLRWLAVFALIAVATGAWFYPP